MHRSIRLPWFIVVVAGVFATPVLSEDCLELVGRWPYGPASAVAVSGDYAYFSSGPSLLVADISDPTSPQVVGEVELGLRVTDMAVSDGYAYLLSEQRRLTVVDVSVPSVPVEVGYHEFGTDVGHIEVADGYAYVAMGDAGLVIIDVATPSTPIEVGFFEEEAADVAVAGQYAYVVSGSYLRVIDVSVPSTPVETGFARSGFHTEVVALSGTFTYTASRSELHVFDVSDPSSPTWIEWLDISMDHDEVKDLEISNDRAYVVSTYEGLQVYDLRTPATPQFAGRHPSFGGTTIRIVANSAYVGQPWGLLTLDLNDPLLPIPVSFFPTMTQVNGIAPAGTCVFAVDEEKVWAIDVGNPFTPVEAGIHETASEATELAVLGNRLIVTEDWAGIEIFDTSGCSCSTGHPRQAGGRRLPGPP